MGNESSSEVVNDERKFLEGLHGMSLDDPNFDNAVNAGTSWSNCQPRHTREAEAAEAAQAAEEEERRMARLMAEAAGGDGDGAEVAVGVPVAGPGGGGSGGGSGGGRGDANKNSSAVGTHRGSGGSRQTSTDSASTQSTSTTQKAATDPQQQQQMSYVQMAKAGYQELVNAIIRPPRADYREESLGPPAFSFCGRRFTRTDFALVTKRGYALQCSHWEPVERVSERIPVVIYMHGNSSARVEVLPQLSYLLTLGLAVFSFDFAGSGKSDGDYVSLGYYEREDLMCVIAHLRATDVVSTIALWGRSMGAATSLMHGDRDPSIACMILDSPFADLTQLCEEMVDKAKEQGITVPNFVTSVAIRMLRGSVKKQADFDIRDISPIMHADKSFIPALFVHGQHDDFIHPRHSEAIHARYAGDKNLIIVEGDHNSPRPKFMFDSVSIFLQTCLQIPNSWALKTLPGMNLMAPPWYYPGTPDPLNVPAELSGIHSPTQKRSPIKDARGVSNSSNGNDNGGSAGGDGDDDGNGGDNNNEEADAAAMALAMELEEEVGMTTERQREIQASLFKMLGQADTEEDDAANGDASNDDSGSDGGDAAVKFLRVNEKS